MHAICGLAHVIGSKFGTLGYDANPSKVITEDEICLHSHGIILSSFSCTV